MARPLLPKSRLRTPAKVYLASSERDLLLARADAVGLSLSDFIRHAALNAKIAIRTTPQPNIEKWSELSRLAGHLSKLTKLALIDRLDGIEPTVLTDLHAAVQSLRLDLIGANDDRS
jgi:hypothetical protein